MIRAQTLTAQMFYCIEIVTTGDVFTTENQVAKTIPVYTIIILAGVSVVLFGFIAVSILLIICIILKRKRK